MANSNRKISDVLARAKRELSQKGVSNSGLDALVLLAHTLSFSKEQIVFNPDFELSESQEENFFKAVARRSSREPVSHIIGKREFFGRDFIVNANVLDPRPDSEILIEAVLKTFPHHIKDLKILELGVGSGCLIITLLLAFEFAQGKALDISCAALETARKNAEIHQVSKRLELCESNKFSALNDAEKFDLLISNPPYISKADIEKLEPEVKNYEPILALDGGFDGLDFYRHIAQEAKKFLKPNGRIFLEIGYGQVDEVSEIFAKHNFLLEAIIPDLAGVQRVMKFKY